MHERSKLGTLGETLVIKWLEKKQVTILARNYSCKGGEVDIIAIKDNILAFIEVKTRKKEYFPTPLVVTYPKQQKIIRAAKFYIMKHNISDKILRFDIASVQINDKKYSVNYIRNAFTQRYNPSF